MASTQLKVPILQQEIVLRLVCMQLQTYLQGLNHLCELFKHRPTMPEKQVRAKPKRVKPKLPAKDVHRPTGNAEAPLKLLAGTGIWK
jgi:hypothetical protein